MRWIVCYTTKTGEFEMNLFRGFEPELKEYLADLIRNDYKIDAVYIRCDFDGVIKLLEKTTEKLNDD